MPKILLVEDDPNLAFMIADGMEGEGFETKSLASAEEALYAFIEFKPDIVFTDVNLKGEMDGFELARQIRKLSDIPIIFITARTQVEDLKKGYEIGNIDYLKKPFGLSELILRTNELFSRMKAVPDPPRSSFIGKYTFSPAEQLLYVNGGQIHLSPTETKILDILNRRKGVIVSKAEIDRHDIGATEGNGGKSKPEKKRKTALNDGTFYNGVVSLREKLGQDKNLTIESVPRKGYKLIIKE